MSILSPLTQVEADALWNELMRALCDLHAEMAELEARPAAVRDMLYGPGVYESYRDLRDEVVDLLEDDIPQCSIVTLNCS